MTRTSSFGRSKVMEIFLATLLLCVLQWTVMSRTVWLVGSLSRDMVSSKTRKTKVLHPSFSCPWEAETDTSSTVSVPSSDRSPRIWRPSGSKGLVRGLPSSSKMGVTKWTCFTVAVLLSGVWCVELRGGKAVWIPRLSRYY